MFILRETQGLTDKYRDKLTTEIEERTGKKCLIIPFGTEVLVGVNEKKYTKLQEKLIKMIGYEPVEIVIKNVVKDNPIEECMLGESKDEY